MVKWIAKERNRVILRGVAQSEHCIERQNENEWKPQHCSFILGGLGGARMTVWDDVSGLVERWLQDQGQRQEVDRLGRIEAQLSRIERTLGELARNPAQPANLRESLTVTYSRETCPSIQVPSGIQSLTSEVRENPLFLRMKGIVEKGG